jgi:acyl transferase domain-containing protein/acyl carrier protein
MDNTDKFENLDGIAIIGMAGRFPGAENIEQFWKNLQNGIESISFFSDQELVSEGVDPALLNDPNYVKAGAILENIDYFDASFFGYSPRDAEIIDPQQRFFLECAWEALETTGYDPEIYRGRIGVYAGSTESAYWFNNLPPNFYSMQSTSSFSTIVGNDKDYLATRVSYKLNLKGPSITVQTACSTSLVATHLACQALLNGECDMALAGGVAIRVPQKLGHLYQEGMLYSAEGHCRAFDARASGTIFGSGMGIIVLKRLADALADRDTILAVIIGSAINNDGSLKIGYTAPSVDGQAHVIAEALDIAGVNPESITYIETHGTGTLLGDPIEVSALTRAFRAHTDAKGFCAIGSVKTNIGHLNAAAGITGLIKTVLALNHRQLPASLHFKEPNPKIDFENSPFFVNTELSEWKAGKSPRRAGVNSFGVGGTNVHVVLEEAPVMESSSPSRPWQLLLLSAKTDTALETTTNNLAEYLKRHADLNLADVAYTLKLGRKVMNHRRMVICHDAEDAISALETLDPKQVFTSVQESKARLLIFMFTGQGAQYVNMALELYQFEQTFREQVDRCSELLKPHLGFDLRDVLYPSEERIEEASQQLKQTAITQPALFVIEYALAKLLIGWEIQPQAMIGHSIGEYVAACLSGVFALEDALALVATRGRLMNQLPTGSMLVVPLPEKEVQSLLGTELSLAAINGPSLCVVSGYTEAIDQLENKLTEKGLDSRRLYTSHAFHSQMMDPILAPFVEQVEKITLHPPRTPYISNVTGTWITPEQATSPQYWARHLRQTVRFSEGVHELLKETNGVLLEIGPGQTLSSLAKRCPEKTTNHVILSSIRHPQEQQSDLAYLLNSLGRLWMAGIYIDWIKFYAKERRHRIALPTYPFERQRYWIEPPKKRSGIDEAKQIISSVIKKPDIADWFYIPAWKQSVLPAPSRIEEQDKQKSRWLVFVDQVGLSSHLVKRLEQHGQDVITVMAGKQYARLNKEGFSIRPQQREDYEALFEELNASDKLPNRIVHMWAISSNYRTKSSLDTFVTSQELGFYSLLYLAQAIGKQKTTDSFRLWILSNNIHDVTGEEELHPEMATILGPCKTIPQEFPNVTCRCIDIDISELRAKHAARLIDRLVAEINADVSDPIVAYRRRHRWVQIFDPIKFDGVSNLNSRLREGGVYLITGGMGGIGLTLAEYLAKTVYAKLTLIGRSTFPDRDEWEQWVRTHGEGDEISRKIRKVQSLEQVGAEVLILRADVANMEQMQVALTQVREKFGAIHGVIHAAGIAGSGMIQLKETETAAHVLAPKVKGTWVLDAVLKDTSLDFFVLCSSTFAIISQVGQVDYCGANAFLDAFAHYKSTKDHTFTVSIDWDGWEEVGIAAKMSAFRDPEAIQPISQNGFEGILPEEGVDAFNRILSLNTSPQVVVAVNDLNAMVRQGNLFASSPPQEEMGKLSSTVSRHSRPTLQTSYITPQNELEQILANIWQEKLGIEQIGTNDNFFELGGDSVVALQIIASAKKAGFQLTPNQIFEYQTIAELAIVLGATLDMQAEQKQVTEVATQHQSSDVGDSALLDANEFNWTQEDLDDITRTLKASIGEDGDADEEC